MFAIIRTGGKQYKVSPNDKIQIERLSAEVGATVNLDDILLVGDEKSTNVGAKGASVTATIVEHTRGPHLIVFKKRRRQNSRRKNGHRQDHTVIQITGIKAA